MTYEALKGEYGTEGHHALLSGLGRILLALQEHPGSTLEELAEVLSVSVTRVSRAISSLVEDDVIVRRRVGNRNEYTLNARSSQIHPDVEFIVRLAGSLTSV